MKQSTGSFNGLFAAFAFLYVGTVRTLVLILPPQQAAEAGLPAVIVGLVVATLLALLLNRIELVPFHRLGRYIYAKGAERSAREWIALGLDFAFQSVLIYFQAGVYTQVLKSSTFFRTPRLVVGLILALPSFMGSQMRLSSVFRISQVFMYGQVLLPLFFLPSRQFSPNNLGEFWRAPGWESLQMLPLLMVLYSGGSVLLMLDDRAKVRLAERIIPAVLAFKLAWFAVGSVIVAGTLGPDLLRITSFPGLKYLQSVRTPGLERFDLILMFLTANVAAGSSILLGKGMALAAGTIGVPQWVSALVVSAMAVLGATRVMLPATLAQASSIVLLFWIAHAISLVVIPRSKEKT